MTRFVVCAKLHKKAEGLDHHPIPGELGVKIYEHICKEAWEMWINHQTMLINEYRLTMVEAKSRKFLREEMEKFLFGAGSETPEGFIPKE